MLTLPIKKKWFDMILSGEKKEEYREIKPYWTRRFIKLMGVGIYNSEKNTFYPFFEKDEKIGYEPKPMYVLFRNGYGNDKPTIKCLIELSMGTGKPEWGAEPNKIYYVLKILSVEKISLEG